MKWYEKGWVIFLLLLFFFPVGAFLLWKYGHWRKPAKIITTVIFACIFLSAIFAPNKQQTQPIADVEQNKTNKLDIVTTPVEEKNTLTVSTEEKQTDTVTTSEPEETIPEPNTSEMVDYIVRTAKENAKTITEEQKAEAIKFLKENYPNYYTNNEIMEKVMYYGSLLEYAYKDIDATIFNLGQDANQAVKYVYRNIENVDDTATQENLKQIKQSLDAL